jgi:hypothetical protein
MLGLSFHLSNGSSIGFQHAIDARQADAERLGDPLRINHSRRERPARQP